MQEPLDGKLSDDMSVKKCNGLIVPLVKQRDGF